jgi:y4mF family transcriptional regulator
MERRVDNSEQFGAAVRDARKARGLRQEDVALASGVGLRFLGELEHGKPTARLDLALRVARAVGLTVEAHDRPDA